MQMLIYYISHSAVIITEAAYQFFKLLQNIIINTRHRKKNMRTGKRNNK